MEDWIKGHIEKGDRHLERRTSKKEFAEFEAVRDRAQVLSNSLKHRYPKLMESISLRLFWEYHNRHWSDCPLHDTLSDAIEEREREDRRDREEERWRKRKERKEHGRTEMMWKRTEEQAKKLAGRVRKEDMGQVRGLQRQAEKIAGEMEKKYPKALQGIRFGLKWEQAKDMDDEDAKESAKFAKECIYHRDRLEDAIRGRLRTEWWRRHNKRRERMRSR